MDLCSERSEAKFPLKEAAEKKILKVEKAAIGW
jgi:hypothetical protein